MADASGPLVARLRPFTSTIFAQMSALAQRSGAINLGQGFPDTDGPPGMLEAARTAIAEGMNQYPPGPGIPALRTAVAERRRIDRGQIFDPDAEVLITVGATEAIAAAMIALVEAEDEVVLLEPYYDAYPAAVAMAGARHRSVPLRRDDGGTFHVDIERLASSITPATRLLLLNSPHNPTGTVFGRAELAAVAELAIAHDLWVITDEVYEYLTFDGAQHIPIATLPGMEQRTLTVSSAGKTFSATGWKIGWVCGPAPLVAAVRAAKQYLTYVAGAPFQPAVAHALHHEMGWVTRLRDDLQAKRDRLCAGLRTAGLDVGQPAGTYFAVADITSLAGRLGIPADGMDFCLALPERAGVVAVPQQVFHDDPATGARFVRFAFCKRDEVIDEAVHRLAALAPAQ